MAKQSTALADPPKHYEMPRPQGGVVVWKYGDGSGDKCTAVITKAYSGSIDCMIFPNGTHMPQAKTGVKYCKDPSLKTMTQPNPGGIWDFTDLEKMVRQYVGISDE